jgi:hypothetical protein
VAITPAWVVQSSSTDPSKQPAWVVPSGSSATPQTTGFDPTKTAKYQGAFDYLNGGISTDPIQNQGQWSGGEGGSIQDNFVDTKDHGVFKDMVSVSGRDYGGEAATGGGPKYQLEYEKMPNKGMTKLGRIDQVYQVKNERDVLDPRGIVWDNNYGWVTSLKNRKPRFADKYGPMIASAAMGGLMGATLPVGALTTGVKTAFNAAPGLANGNWKSAAAGVAGAALGAGATGMGLPDWIVPATKAGVGIAVNGFNPQSLINAGLGYGAGQLGLPSWVVPTATSLGSMYTKGRNS